MIVVMLKAVHLLCETLLFQLGLLSELALLLAHTLLLQSSLLLLGCFLVVPVKLMSL